MKRKIVAITILSIVTGLVILNSVKTKDIEVEKTQKRINNVNTLTMMIETEAGTGNYQEVKQSEWPTDGYVFNASLSRCENGGTLSWDDDAKKVVMKSNVSDKCYVYFDIYVEPTMGQKICNNSGANSLSCYIANSIYIEDGINGLYYHDGVGTYTNADQEAEDNSYRYSGADPNNYVCFGSDAATCPNDNLYRIIGLFDDDQDETYNIKLIKSDYTTSEMLGTDGDYVGRYAYTTNYYKGNMGTNTIIEYMWGYDGSYYGSNNWRGSKLNTINLNTNYINYLNNIDTKWVNMIATTTWYLGSMDDENYTSKAFYEGERNNAGYDDNPTTYRDEIGLIYASDYGYAASPENWNNNLYAYSNNTIRNNNWIYMGLNEWIITTYSINDYNVFYLYNNGSLNGNSAESPVAVRPSFYLNSNVILSSGDGSKKIPFRISV